MFQYFRTAVPAEDGEDLVLLLEYVEP